MRFIDLALAGVIALATMGSGAAHAGELGVIGPTYEIKEPDMLEWIEKRVKAKVDSGEVARYQQQQTEKIKAKINNPEPLKSVSKAMKNRTLYFDPTFIVEENVDDGTGKILVPAGTVINPLDRVGLSRSIIFFDARDATQVAFAKRFIDQRNGLVMPVLVGGSYMDLMKLWKITVYFDQQSALIHKFNIEHVPAIVIQEGKRLRIDEIAL